MSTFAVVLVVVSVWCAVIVFLYSSYNETDSQGGHNKQQQTHTAALAAKYTVKVELVTQGTSIALYGNLIVSVLNQFLFITCCVYQYKTMCMLFICLCE